MREIRTPTLLVDSTRGKRNIAFMVKKCSQSGVRFRPHFKTHQSADIGLWFRESGVKAITVSSVQMASYFAANGWDDITIAFLVNPLEIENINKLSCSVSLNLTVDSVHTVSFLSGSISEKVGIWIKTDTGYGRSGIPTFEEKQILDVAKSIAGSDKLVLKGFLAHAGHSYDATSNDEIRSIYLDTAEKMKKVQNLCRQEGLGNLEISVGDTPTCSVMSRLDGVDEIRCGNFVFFDITQFFLGSCSLDDIAVAMACPVVASYPKRNQVVIHGGAIHLSKDSVVDSNGEKSYGLVGQIERGEFGTPFENTIVKSLSQEHGVLVSSNPAVLSKQPGDILLVYPVHSCLAVNEMKQMMTTDGQVISTMGIGWGENNHGKKGEEYPMCSRRNV